MRLLFLIMLLLHAGIHLSGFIHSYRLANIPGLSDPIHPVFGILWLLVFLLFLSTALMLGFKKVNWYWIAFTSVLLSQTLILGHWQESKSGTLVNLLILIIAFLAGAMAYFKHGYTHDILALQQDLHNKGADLLTEQDIAHLPELVQRYIRLCGAIGKPKVHSFRVSFSGRIRKNNETPWMPFTSEQYNSIATPARLFFMNAIMKNLPVAGYHRYLNGKAFMDIRLFSLFRVQYMKGHDMDVAETVTFFNDMCCMAPATLIDPRIQWLEADSKKVSAAFSIGAITIHAILYFNEQGELVNFRSDDRLNADTGTRMPWYTPLSAYREINGHKLPGFAEAYYRYAIGPICYGNFRIESLDYNPTVPW